MSREMAPSLVRAVCDMPREQKNLCLFTEKAASMEGVPFCLYHESNAVSGVETPVLVVPAYG